MFAGHFGLAAGIKALDTSILSKRRGVADTQKTSAYPDVPLWALMLSTQLLDVGFVLLLIPGIESFGGDGGYGGGWIHAYYTHSLIGSLAIALGAGALVSRWWGRQGGLIIGVTVFSHWLLDLLVHRPDLPLLPGNLGDLPLLGFGLWSAPAVSITLEALLIIGGGLCYWVSVLTQTSDTRAVRQGARPRAVLAGAVLSGLLVLSLVASVAGIG